MFLLGLSFAVVLAVAQLLAAKDAPLQPLQIAGALASELFMLPSPVTGDELLRNAGEDHLMWLEMALASTGVCFSTATNVLCGHGVNI